jgi:acetyl esterase/lipase
MKSAGKYALAMGVGVVGYVGLAMANPVMAQAAPATAAASAPVSAPGPASGEVRKLSAQDYAAIPFVEQPDLSPNGEWVAGLFGVNGTRQMCMIKILGGESVRKCLGLPDGMTASGIQWVNDDYVVLSVTQQQSIEGRFIYVSRALGVSRETGKFVKLKWDLLGQNVSRVLWVSHDARNEILLSGSNSIYQGDEFYPAIYRVNVATGKSNFEQRHSHNVLWWNADAQGQVRTGVTYDDDRRLFQMYYRPNGTDSLQRLERADARKREDLTDPEIFLPGGNHVIVIRNGDGKEPSALWEVDLVNHSDVAKVYEAPAGRRIAYTIPSPDGSRLLGVGLRGVQDETVWLDPDLAKMQEAFDKAAVGRHVRIVSFNANRQRMLVSLDRPDAPSAIYFYDTTEGSLHRLAYQYEKLGMAVLSPVRAVRYKARDGLEIEAIVTLPAGFEGEGGKKGKPLPFIVLPHGGPWAHDGLSFDYWPQFLANLGYGVIQPNFRGSTGYGEDFERKGEGQMGLAMQDDVNDALAWAVKEGLADGKRACIMGASYGGYAAMWGLVRDADLWRCGISIAGVASLRREVNDMDDNYLMGGLFSDQWKAMTPDFAAVSPANAVDRIKAPLLLVHGKMDERVAYGQSTNMADKMRAAGKQVEFLSLPKADHYYTREPDRLALLQSIEAFLKKHNPSDSMVP